MSQLIVKAQLFLLYVLHIQNKEVTDIFPGNSFAHSSKATLSYL